MPRGPETQIYSIENTDLSLVATAEITLGGMLTGSDSRSRSLPLQVRRHLALLSHGSRRARQGDARASTACISSPRSRCSPSPLPDWQRRSDASRTSSRIEEEIFQGLGIPYRVIDTATGDLGGPAYRKFDLEAWMPGRESEYGEVTSASNCTDYQARRLGTSAARSPDEKGTQFVHTLNGTAIAVTRALIAILENYQQADGSVVIPEVLRPWVGKDRIG